jgi:hypothetical protein
MPPQVNEPRQTLLLGAQQSPLERVDDVLQFFDSELIERRGGPVMRDLWTAVAAYREKVLEARTTASRRVFTALHIHPQEHEEGHPRIIGERLERQSH